MNIPRGRGDAGPGVESREILMHNFPRGHFLFGRAFTRTWREGRGPVRARILARVFQRVACVFAMRLKRALTRACIDVRSRVVQCKFPSAKPGQPRSPCMQTCPPSPFVPTWRRASRPRVRGRRHYYRYYCYWPLLLPLLLLPLLLLQIRSILVYDCIVEKRVCAETKVPRDASDESVSSIEIQKSPR